MKSKPLLWMIAAFAMLILTAFTASALEYYFSYRMNFEPGAQEYHLQKIRFSGNFTMTLPSSFTFTNSTMSYSQSGSNYTWSSSNSTEMHYTIRSPSSCTEGDLYKSQLYESGNKVDEFVYVCIDDSKIVDYKVEYGHGCGNYLAEDEPYISNEPAALFNLVRVWNIGSYLDPDEDALNAEISCFYEDYPVRTYGRVEVGYPPNGVNGTFLWDIIYGGYWFRIGVLSQEVSGKSIGSTYSVNCTELTYNFSHQRVVASFPNYSLEARSVSPLTKNTTTIGGKDRVVITNNEKYPVYSLTLNFVADGYIESNFVGILGPGESAIFFADPGTNTTATFIPSWQRNCFSPVYYMQTLSNTSSAVNQAPSYTNIPSQAWAENTSNNNAFDLDNYFSDAENNTLTFGYTGNVNITVSINSTTHEVSFSQPAGWTGIEYVKFYANDGNSTTYSNNVTLVVFPATVVQNASGTTTVIEYKSKKKTVYVYVNQTQNVSVSEPLCKELWLCSEWSECMPDESGSKVLFRTRSCEEVNNCLISMFSPPESEPCEVECESCGPGIEIPGVIDGQPELQKCRLCTIIPASLLILLIILLILILTDRQNEKESAYREDYRKLHENCKNEVEKWKRKENL